MGTVINNDDIQNNKFIPSGEITRTERHGNTTVVYTKDFAYAIPDDINETTNATLIVHGDGGLAYMLQHSGLGICEYLDSNDVNSVLVMPLTGNGEEYAEYFADELNNVSEQLNLENKEKSIISYSNGVYVTDDVAKKLIEDDPDLPPLKIAVIDPDTAYLSTPSSEMASAITSNNPNVIIFEKNGELYSREKDFYKFYDKYVDNGVNIAFVGGDKDHGYEFFDAISDGLLETMSNDSASEYAKSLFDSRRDRGYRVVEFDGARFTDIDTNLMASTFDRNIQSFPKYDTTFINPINTDLVNRIANLSDLTISSNLRAKLSNSPQGIEILSNLEYVNSSMNSLRAFARTIASSATASSSFSSIFPNKAVSLIQKYYSYLVELMNSLTDETMAIESFAEGIADMDSYFANNVPEEKVDTVSNGGVPSMTSTANTGSMDTQSGAIRPGKPEGSDITPIGYSKFTKKQDNDNNMVYTYYDKNGNVIGETVKNGSDVVSSYYDYENADGSTVRVNYDSKLSSAGVALGAAATTDATSEVVQEESQTSGRNRNTGNADIIYEDETDDNKVEQSIDDSGDEKHGTLIVANPDESVIGKTSDGQDIIVSENKVDGEYGKPVSENTNGQPGNETVMRQDNNVVEQTSQAETEIPSQPSTIPSNQPKEENGQSGGTTVTPTPSTTPSSTTQTETVGHNEYGKPGEYTGQPADIIFDDDASSQGMVSRTDQIAKTKNEELIQSREKAAGVQAEQEMMWESVLGTDTGQTKEERIERILGADKVYQDALTKREEYITPAQTTVTPQTTEVPTSETPVTETPTTETEQPQNVTPKPQPSYVNNNAPQPSVINDTKPVTEVEKPIDEIKEPEVTEKSAVEEKPSSPTYTNNYGPYNYYNSVPRREETIVPSVDNVENIIDTEVKVPEVKPDVIDNNKQTIEDTSIHKNNSNNNAGRVLGTIAGVAAAGAGLAGLAYGANKIIKEQDEENEEENKEEYEKDENGEISLSDEI